MEKVIVVRSFVALLAFVLLASACSGSGSSESTDVAAAPVAEDESTTTTAEVVVFPEFASAVRPEVLIPEPEDYSDPVQELTERYFLYIEAQYAAAAPPVADPDFEPLQELVTGERAEEVREFITSLRDNELVRVIPDQDLLTVDIRLPSATTIGEADGSTFRFENCIVDPSELRRRSDGEVSDSGIFTELVTIEMLRVDGEWRVSKDKRTKEYEGISTCPEE